MTNKPPQVPVTVTLLVPYYIPRARGVHAAAKYTHNVKVRMTEDERSDVANAARLCGVFPAEFIRWCAVKGAQAVIKETEEDNDDTETNDGPRRSRK